MKKGKLNKAIKAYEDEKKLQKEKAKISILEYSVDKDKEFVCFTDGTGEGFVESGIITLNISFRKHTNTTKKQVYKGLKKALKVIILNNGKKIL